MKVVTIDNLDDTFSVFSDCRFPLLWRKSEKEVKSFIEDSVFEESNTFAENLEAYRVDIMGNSYSVLAENHSDAILRTLILHPPETVGVIINVLHIGDHEDDMIIFHSESIIKKLGFWHE